MANSHDAPWLTNSRTEMFSAYAGTSEIHVLS